MLCKWLKSTDLKIPGAIYMDNPDAQIKVMQTNSLLNIMERELDDFSQNWTGDPQTIPQRFDDLFTLVKSAKAVLNTGAMD